jgi:hypothetical protein
MSIKAAKKEENMTTPIAKQQVAGLTPAEMAEVIADIFSETLTGLIARRDAAYSAAVEPLNAEREALAQESADIEDAKENLQALLPARAREAQRQADALLLAGKTEEAAAKVREAEESANAPQAIGQRQRAISARLEAIAEEKSKIKARCDEAFYSEAQRIVRASERAFFLTLLDGIERVLLPTDLWRNVNARVNLTAPERSDEWRGSQKWYGR